MKVTIDINNCDKCPYYIYIRATGYDCFHEDAPEMDSKERNLEPLAENREGFFPLWCPFLKKGDEKWQNTI